MLSIKNHIKGLKRAPNWLNDSEDLIINLIELQKFGMENLAPKIPRTVICHTHLLRRCRDEKMWHLKPRNKGQLIFTGMIKITGLNGKRNCDSASMHQKNAPKCFYLLLKAIFSLKNRIRGHKWLYISQNLMGLKKDGMNNSALKN